MRVYAIPTVATLLLASSAGAGPITATFGGSNFVSATVGIIATVDVAASSMAVQDDAFDFQIILGSFPFPPAPAIGRATIQSSSVSVDPIWDVDVICGGQSVPGVSNVNCSVQGTLSQAGVAELQSLIVSVTFIYDWAPFEECFIPSATCIPAGQQVHVTPAPGDFFGETQGLSATITTLADIYMVVPEPGTAGLVALGCVGLALRGRARARARL